MKIQFVVGVQIRIKLFYSFLFFLNFFVVKAPFHRGSFSDPCSIIYSSIECLIHSNLTCFNYKCVCSRLDQSWNGSACVSSQNKLINQTCLGENDKNGCKKDLGLACIENKCSCKSKNSSYWSLYFGCSKNCLITLFFYYQFMQFFGL